MTDWTEQDEAQYRERVRAELPVACACHGIDPGETICPCAKKREQIRREIASTHANLPGDKRQK